ncbi:MAG: DUF3662 domain-containing protein [Anaerolineae bacterium]|nr:DUF3662 domain-containing protein [Anaerolineae bacterium]
MDARAFSRFETLAQRLVEGAFGRLFGGRSLAADVAAQLADYLEESWQAGETANEIHLFFHPGDFASLQQPEDLEARLATYVRELAQQGGVALSGPVRVVLEQDDRVAWRGVRIEARQRAPEETVTGVLGQEVALAYERLRALDAFLIVNGRRHVPLDRPVLTIGRRMDNDVIVDSPVVSREHAQIRWRYGRFVLYDAGSRGGVAVNGEACSECVLQPGDLITLSGRVSLIYGEGLERRDELPARRTVSQETLTLTRDDLA